MRKLLLLLLLLPLFGFSRLPRVIPADDPPGSSSTSMATRYWVGNGGDFSDSAHWSLTSGGAGGASVPFTTDDAVMDANSFTLDNQIVTTTAGLGPQVHSFSSATVTHSPTINLASQGSITIQSGNANFTGVQFGGTDIYQGQFAPGITYAISNGSYPTLTTGGTLMPLISISNPVGSTDGLTLTDNLAFLQGGQISLTFILQGTSFTFSAAAHNITAWNIFAFSLGSATLNLDNSTITVNGQLYLGPGITVSANGTTWIFGSGATTNIDGTSSLIQLLGTSTSSRMTLTNNSGGELTITGSKLSNTVLDGSSGWKLVNKIENGGGNDWGGGGGGPSTPPKFYYTKLPPTYVSLP